MVWEPKERKIQKSPNKTETPSMINHKICTKRRAWPGIGAEPPLPTSQNPILATLTPEHKASAQPHQYVTPSTPQTGSVLKHFTGQEEGTDTGQRSTSPSLLVASEGKRMAEETSSDRTGKTKMRSKNKKIMEIWGLEKRVMFREL